MILALLNTAATVVLGALLIGVGVYFMVVKRFVLGIILIVVGVLLGGLNILGVL